MRIHEQELTDVSRYVDSHKHVKLEDKQPEYELYLKRVTKFKEIGPETRILEVGTGTGWFPILCKKNGLQCKGLEISPQLVEYAREYGRSSGVEPDIELGNVEETDLGEAEYDVIIASSVFEHVEDWRTGLRNIHRALKPGGLFYFFSTNKFCPRSGEYRFPLYGWLPNSLRFKLRVWRQGPDIMKLGIDFNQFTPCQLRRFFRKLGFTRIYDRFDITGPGNLRNPKPLKRAIVTACQRFRPLRELALWFLSGNMFVCVK
jgi:SAM-dependent methyltransferase